MISAELAAHIKQVDEEWELGNLYENGLIDDTCDFLDSISKV